MGPTGPTVDDVQKRDELVEAERMAKAGRVSAARAIYAARGIGHAAVELQRPRPRDDDR